MVFRRDEMNRVIRIVAIAALSIFSLPGFASSASDNQDLLQTREAVWRAWFANDTKALQELVPADTIAISSGEERWQDQGEIFRAAAQFKAGGGKLVRLEFPRTEVQRYGDFAVTYSKYLYEIEMNGKRSVTSGRVTEVFVQRNGKWTNPGWHTDAEK
jgi:Domain of unknown function (DUF4440)